MANVKYGGGVTDIRGSIGGTTFTRGASGAVARQRVKCINPNSNSQSARRAVVSALSQQWSKLLTPTERADWNAYAAGTNFLNKVGDTIQISGLACYIRSNTLRLQMGLASTALAPITTGQAAGTVAVITATVSDGKIHIAEPSAGFDKSVAGEYIAVFVAAPMNPGRVSSPRGWKYLTKVTGNVSPPTFPIDVLNAYTHILGQQYGVSMTHLDHDGRVSAPVDVIVAAAA